LILMITNLWLGKQTMQFTSEIFWGKQSVTCYYQAHGQASFYRYSRKYNFQIDDLGRARQSKYM
jgi:hypothetical protein